VRLFKELEARNAELERKIRQLLHERYGHAEVGEAK